MSVETKFNRVNRVSVNMDEEKRVKRVLLTLEIPECYLREEMKKNRVNRGIELSKVDCTFL